jgi:hypothetical protein
MLAERLLLAENTVGIHLQNINALLEERWCPEHSILLDAL